MSKFTPVLRVRGRSGSVDAVLRSAQSGGKKSALCKELNLTGQLGNIGQSLNLEFGKTLHQTRPHYFLRMYASSTPAQSS